MSPVEQFLSRLPATGADAERDMVKTAFAIASNFRQRADEIRSDRRLSEVAKAEDVKRAAMGSFKEHLNQIRRKAAAANADLANLKKAFAIKPLERTDVVGFLEHQELRSILRAMLPHDVMHLAKNDDAVAEAILLAHPSLSGLSVDPEEPNSPSPYESIRGAYLERKFGAQMKGAQRRQEVLDNVNAAIEIATRDFLKESGLSEQELA